MMQTVNLSPPTRTQGLTEEDISRVPKIEKDTLMPKDMSQEKIDLKEASKLSPKSSTASMRKVLGLSKRNSEGLASKLKSISFNDKPSKRNSKANDNYLPLPEEQPTGAEEKQIEQLRERTEVRMRYLEEGQRLVAEREKHFKERLKEFNEMTDEPHSHIAYDYEGETFKAALEIDKIKFHKMRSGLGTASKRFREGYSNADEPLESKIEIQKQRDKGEGSAKGVKPMEMPIFPMKFKDFGHTQDLHNYKLEDYRKHFGRRYSRLEQTSQTIDLNTTVRTHREDPFSEKKHLRDEVEAEQRVSGARTTFRKLALPRLHGKYKVLDRY